MAVAFTPGAFGDVVERAQQLDIDSKEELIRLLKAWVVEERREEILRSLRLAEQEYAEGKTKSGTVADLMADLHAED